MHAQRQDMRCGRPGQLNKRKPSTLSVWNKYRKGIYREETMRAMESSKVVLLLRYGCQ
jgi:hypothetical protein